MYDYAGGLEDWANAGEELAGEHGGGRASLLALVREVPTLRAAATAADARDRIGDATFLLVLDEDGVVLGKVLARSLEQDGIADGPVGDLMIEGPTTIRPTEHLVPLLERMQQARTSSVVVTSNQGELLGVLFTEDAEAAVAELHDDHEHAHGHHR